MRRKLFRFCLPLCCIGASMLKLTDIVNRRRHRFRLKFVPIGVSAPSAIIKKNLFSFRLHNSLNDLHAGGCTKLYVLDEGCFDKSPSRFATLSRCAQSQVTLR